MKPYGFDIRFCWNDLMNPLWAEDEQDACDQVGQFLVDYIVNFGIEPEDLIYLGVDRDPTLVQEELPL